MSLPIFVQTLSHYLWSEDVLDRSNVPSLRLHLKDEHFRHANIWLAEREGAI